MSDLQSQIDNILSQIDALMIDPNTVQDNLDQIQQLYDELIQIFMVYTSQGTNQVDTIDSLINLVTAHISNLNNPHAVTAAQVGLGNVQNLAPADMPISTAVQDALDQKSYDMTQHIENMGNPHEVTGAQIGLSYVQGPTGGFDGLSYLDSATGANVFEIASLAELQADEVIINDHIANTSNPHQVTAAQVGLDQVDNTSDLDKPISTATQSYVDTQVATVQTALDNHIANQSNPHNVTLSQLGISDYPDDPADLEVPDSVQQLINQINSNLNTHTANMDNPHGVTATQVGLGEVDNTSDADKPISNATQSALDGLQASINTNTTNITTNANNIATNTANIATNSSDIYTLKYEVSQMGLGTLGFGGIYATIGDVTSPQDGVLYLIGTSPTFSLQIYYNSTWTVVMAQAEIDLSGYVTEDSFEAFQNTVNNSLQGIVTNANNITTLTTTVSNHTSNISNPHQVTASQVGLGNVQNITPAEMPISTATQTALDNITNSLPNLTFSTSAITSGRFDSTRMPLIPTESIMANFSGAQAAAMPMSVNNLFQEATTYFTNPTITAWQTVLNVPNISDFSNASNLTSGTIPAARIGNGAITMARMANLSANTVVGNATNVAAAPTNLAFTGATSVRNSIGLGGDSGALAVANGGTGQTTAQGFVNAARGVSYVIVTSAAGTVAKTGVLTSFTLFIGTVVTVEFSTHNTATNPTLNINNTAAGGIFIGNTRQTGNMLYAGIWTMMRNGANWIVLSAPTWTFTISAANGTSLNLATSSVTFVGLQRFCSIQFTFAQTVTSVPSLGQVFGTDFLFNAATHALMAGFPGMNMSVPAQGTARCGIFVRLTTTGASLIVQNFTTNVANVQPNQPIQFTTSWVV